jgi:hypothetical protein
MVEAVIMLPVLGVLLVAVPALHERFAARQQTLIAARGCAFAHALTGCADVPAACTIDPGATAAPAAAPESDPVAIALETTGDAFGVFDELPLVGAALGALLGDTTDARAVMALRPWGDDLRAPVQIEGALSLACNERPRDVQAIARDLFCRRLPVIDCGGSR